MSDSVYQSPSGKQSITNGTVGPCCRKARSSNLTQRNTYLTRWLLGTGLSDFNCSGRLLCTVVPGRSRYLIFRWLEALFHTFMKLSVWPLHILCPLLSAIQYRPKRRSTFCLRLTLTKCIALQHLPECRLADDVRRWVSFTTDTVCDKLALIWDNRYRIVFKRTET